MLALVLLLVLSSQSSIISSRSKGNNSYITIDIISGLRGVAALDARPRHHIALYHNMLFDVISCYMVE